MKEKQEQFRIDWMRNTLQGCFQENSNLVYLITNTYEVFIVNKNLKLTGSDFSKEIEFPIRCFLMRNGNTVMYNNIQHIGILPPQLFGEFPSNCIEIPLWEYDYYERYHTTSEDLKKIFNNVD